MTLRAARARGSHLSKSTDAEDLHVSLETGEKHPRTVFTEGLAIDYKWFDKWNIEPRYEFGYGLR